ncbi:MAG: endo-1,4-beta-xylanase [Candidatus Bathyarchaeia archaeon]|nr:endo-1,4-beta-xylanase [Candidatus Bathyarchaeota archaeon]
MLLRRELLYGVIIGLIAGLAIGSIIRGMMIETEIRDLYNQISDLKRQIMVVKVAIPSLRNLAEKCGIYIGAAVERSLLDIPDYAYALKQEFNILTTENALKFGPVHPQRDAYSFSDADYIISFAESNGMKVRGHTLVWHQQLPSWVAQGNYSREEWISIIREHIMTVVGRYKGRIYAWDVINEAIADDGTLRDTIWLRNIGPEYIEMAFRWAHEADPQAILFYNDYGAEGLNVKSNAIYNLVKSLLEKGVPIHGVGLQMHVSLENPSNPQEVAANIKRLNDLGLEVHITEMDVRIRMPARWEDLVEQAKIYRDFLRVCLSAERCKAFVMWGFTDKYSWIPGYFSGYGAALIFDESYVPKPAYYYIAATFIEHLTKK